MIDRAVEIEFNWKVYENPDLWLLVKDMDGNIINNNLIRFDDGEFGIFIETHGASEIYRVWTKDSITMVVPKATYELFEDLVIKSDNCEVYYDTDSLVIKEHSII